MSTGYQVVLGATCGRISGVDSFSVELAAGLRARGIGAHILLTNPGESVPDPLPLPRDVPVTALAVRASAPWAERWRAMIEYLEARAPCIYVPNYDWQHSGIIPKLSKWVGVVGIVHSDDPDHYEHLDRLGAYWNVVVSVSPAITAQIAARYPALVDRLVTLPYGVAVARSLCRAPRRADSPLRVIYAGRLSQHQKRVLDLPSIVSAALRRGVPIELTIVGGGTDAETLRAACAPLVSRGAVRFLGTLPRVQVLREYEASDVVLLPSAFEGLPISLLEAMGRGCVPVVSEIRSGIPELVQHNRNGLRVPVGDTEAFAACLEQLYRDPDHRQRMARAAYASIVDRGYTAETMTARYIDLFERVWRDTANQTYIRPRGSITPPPWMRPVWKHYLPARLRRCAEPLYLLLRRHSPQA